MSRFRNFTVVRNSSAVVVFKRSAKRYPSIISRFSCAFPIFLFRDIFQNVSVPITRALRENALQITFELYRWPRMLINRFDSLDRSSSARYD